MTEREQATFDFIKAYIEENGYAPTHEEIAQGIYVSDTTAVKKILTALEKKNIIRVRKYTVRAITLVGYKVKLIKED